MNKRRTCRKHGRPDALGMEEGLSKSRYSLGQSGGVGGLWGGCTHLI